MAHSHVKDIVLKQRKFFKTQQSYDLAFRKEQLQNLMTLVRKNQERFFAALREDLNKPEMESVASETGAVVEEIKFTLKHLDEWVKPQKVSTPIVAQPGRAMIVPEPKGVVLNMSPWNYPISLALNPVVGALAAGNCVVLKPSELAPACSKLLNDLIREHFPIEVFSCIEGDHTVAEALLKERFDHIFFTGSTQVGKKVMAAASTFLTPVTLELGGKSPCIVDAKASLDIAAKRIVWGKFFNAGQTCVAPDYVLVHESVQNKFLEKLKARVKEELGEDPSLTPDYARIINDRHFNRLLKYMSDGKLVCGGDFKKEEKYIAPTVLKDVSIDSDIMKEEIFGPILPVLSYSTFDSLKKIISERANPLALYVFTESAEFENKVISEIPAGGVCVNDVLMHLACAELPFGGRGASGMGAYHGKASFDVFTHYKSVLHRSTLVDPNIRYRPYEKRFALMKWFMG
ncbi:MAG: aldehyde dehydrogenase [Bdellovibrionota bacterium]